MALHCRLWVWVSTMEDNEQDNWQRGGFSTSAPSHSPKHAHTYTERESCGEGATATPPSALGYKNSGRTRNKTQQQGQYTLSAMPPLTVATPLRPWRSTVPLRTRRNDKLPEGVATPTPPPPPSAAERKESMTQRHQRRGPIATPDPTLIPPAHGPPAATETAVTCGTKTTTMGRVLQVRVLFCRSYLDGHPAMATVAVGCVKKLKKEKKSIMGGDDPYASPLRRKGGTAPTGQPPTTHHLSTSTHSRFRLGPPPACLDSTGESIKSADRVRGRKHPGV